MLTVVVRYQCSALSELATQELWFVVMHFEGWPRSAPSLCSWRYRVTPGSTTEDVLPHTARVKESNWHGEWSEMPMIFHLAARAQLFITKTSWSARHSWYTCGMPCGRGSPSTDAQEQQISALGVRDVLISMRTAVSSQIHTAFNRRLWSVQGCGDVVVGRMPPQQPFIQSRPLEALQGPNVFSVGTSETLSSNTQSEVSQPRSSCRQNGDAGPAEVPLYSRPRVEDEYEWLRCHISCGGSIVGYEGASRKYCTTCDVALV